MDALNSGDPPGRMGSTAGDRPMTVRAAIRDHLGTRQVARVIYGAIIGMALIEALQDHPPSATEVAAALAGTATAVGLAELYSEIVGAETRTRRRVTRDQMREITDNVLAVGLGILFPDVFFFLAALGAMRLDTAFAVAQWSGLALIGFYGYCATRLAGASVSTSIVRAVAIGAIGGLLIALKAVVH